LLKKKQALDRDRPGGKTVYAIPTARMDAYVAEMRRRLAAKQIGAKREFLQEVLKEVRVRGGNVTLTYKLSSGRHRVQVLYTIKGKKSGRRKG